MDILLADLVIKQESSYAENLGVGMWGRGKRGFATTGQVAFGSIQMRRQATVKIYHLIVCFLQENNFWKYISKITYLILHLFLMFHTHLKTNNKLLNTYNMHGIGGTKLQNMTSMLKNKVIQKCQT